MPKKKQVEETAEEAVTEEVTDEEIVAEAVETVVEAEPPRQLAEHRARLAEIDKVRGR